MGIRRRILLSFLALFAVVFIAITLISTFLISHAVDRRLREQAAELAGLFARQPGLLNETSLDFVRQAFGAQTVTADPPGRVPPGSNVFRAPITSERELVMVYDPQKITFEKTSAGAPLMGVAVAGIVLVVVLGLFTARAIARPLEDLAIQARGLPAGEVRPVGGGAELDHLVEALNRMLVEVRRTERLVVMGQMAAGVAHEIRNPLSSMKMTVQMLRESAKDAEPYNLLLREIERLELTAAELAAGSQPLRREPARLDTVVGDVLELMSRRLEHLGVRVERRFSPVPEVGVDVARFKGCVMNLVLNGAQAMPSGGPLLIEVGPRDGKVRFAVTDAGAGVPPELRSRVFEPFVTSKQDGVGLGLALTKRIVEDHGGAIGFEPRPVGTTFWIELPQSPA